MPSFVALVCSFTEENTTNVKTKAAVQVSNYVQHLPRSPSVSLGEMVKTPQDSIKHHKHVARHNNRDETLCLANAFFYLNGTSLKWFKNNEKRINIWEEFTSLLENIFGKKKKV
ncbi:hypothetical protein LAZ67_6001787 [Cordylochernes scorpioides]|uniref:Uncharacterized protein n=1 Tax=Cordylochernes scorpioides TaxID=51811 RepID=A0ABY6KN12_9ARAC|nr:hypothetical protein LAZ67_6001787 [Cordylochernes scorpioides]